MNDTNFKVESICVIGLGGVGGFFGGRIAHYLESNSIETPKVYFLARGKHLEAIQSHGLILNTEETQGMICRPAIAVDDLDSIPVSDLYLLCVKSYDLDDAVLKLKRHIRENSMILPLLNGADIYDRIRTHLKTGIVLPACAYVGTHIEKPGVVSQKGGGGIILCGNDPKVSGFDSAPLIDLFDKAGISFQWKPDPFPSIWEKFVFIAGYGLVTADTGMTMGEVLENNDVLESARRIMREITSIAHKKGVNLPENIVDVSIEKAKNFPYEVKTSFQRDVETKGKRNEGDLFGGTVIRLGESLGIETPETRSVYASIQSRL